MAQQSETHGNSQAPDKSIPHKADNNAAEVSEESLDSTSSEAAGVARGVTRTLQGVLRRGGVFRRGLIRKGVVGRVPVRRVAKLSDVAGNAMEVASNVSDVASASFIDRKKEKENTTHAQEAKTGIRGKAQKKWRFVVSSLVTWTRPVLNVTAVFAKNVVLGEAVFGTYESLTQISYPTQQIPNPSLHHEDQSGSNTPPSYKPISQHYLAGSTAGTVHAGLTAMLDRISSSKLISSLLGATQPLPPSPAFASLVLHHAMAHALLFGGYEHVRRTLLQTFEPFLQHDSSPSQNGHDQAHSPQEPTVGVDTVAITALAGGLAGMGQHVLGHYSGLWLAIDGETSLYQQQLHQQKKLQQRHKMVKHLFLPRPALGPTLVAFPTFAVAFLAFEYGKEIIAS